MLSVVSLAVQKRIPEAITVFVTAPSRDALETRLRARATESEGEIEERLDVAERQLELEPRFRYRIVNDDLERALGELERMVRHELDAAASMSGRDSSSR